MLDCRAEVAAYYMLLRYRNPADISGLLMTVDRCMFVHPIAGGLTPDALSVGSYRKRGAYKSTFSDCLGIQYPKVEGIVRTIFQIRAPK